MIFRSAFVVARLSKMDVAIQQWVEQQFGFRPEPDWIAHGKRLCNVPIDDERIFEKGRFSMCPPDKLPALQEAFRHFGLLPPR